MIVKFQRNIDFKTGIKKLVYQVHYDLRIKSISVDIINDMIKHLCEEIIAVANKLAQLGKRKRVGQKEVKSALVLLIPGELVKHAISEATRSLVSEPHSKLLFTSAVVLKIMKKNISSGFEIGKNGVIYLTSALEYLTAEIIDVAGRVTIKSNTKQIKPRDIMMGIEDDEELYLLFGGTILGTSSLVQTGGKKRKIKNTDAIRDITTNALRRLMFKAGVKYASSVIYEDSRSILREIIYKIVEKSNEIKTYKGHQTFMFEDGKEALRILKINVYITRGYPGKKRPCLGSEKVKNIESEKIGKRKRNPSANLTKKIKQYQISQCTLIPHAPIERLVKELSPGNYRGLDKFESDFIWLVHAVCEEYMVSLFRDAYSVALYSNRQTLNYKDIYFVMSLKFKSDFPKIK
jgi:histone H2B